MSRVLFVIIAFVLVPGAASASRCGGSGPELKEPAVCSRHFGFQGLCGRPNYMFKDWDDVAIAVGAWEEVPIRILFVSADARIQTKWRAVTASMYAGNSFNADPLTPWAQATAGILDLRGDVVATIHAGMTYRPDLSMQFPAGQPWQDTHLDVHLQCTPTGAPFFGSLSVWYKLDP